MNPRALLSAVVVAIACTWTVGHAQFEQNELVPVTPALNDLAGTAASVSANTMAMGAPGDDVVATNAGAVYMFVRNDSEDNWDYVASLNPSSLSASDEFGAELQLDGDTLVVGAQYYGGSDSGAAYVFDRDYGGTEAWGERVRLEGDAASGARFGHSVSISGDRIAVGAVFEGSNQGSVYIYERNEGGSNNWGEVKEISGSTNDFLGLLVSLDGDRLAVQSATDLHIFEEDEGGTGAWGEVTSFTSSASSLDLDGDILIIGMPYTNAGGAEIHGRNEGGTDNWGEVTDLEASDGVSGDRFGWSVSLYCGFAVVGADMDDNTSQSDKGAFYLFRQDEGGTDHWGEVGKHVSSDVVGERFGSSVSIDGNFAVSGAVHGYTTATSGKAYAFENVTCPADVNLDGTVDVLDLLAILGSWGQTCSAPGCAEDIDQSGTVDVADLLVLLAAWDACPCSAAGTPDSLCDELDDAGLDCEDALEVIYDAIESEDEETIDNMTCWLEHYLCCCNPLCSHTPDCPDADPFD